MKYLITAAFFASLSFSSYADYIKPKSMSCSELNDLLEAQGSVSIVYGLFGISRGTMYADERGMSCMDGDIRQMNLRTSDGFCQSGYMCIHAPRRIN